MALTVGEVARLAKVSVRTLHHYDETGLLSPAQRSEAGYRLYGHVDLEKLQQILFYRELGFGLDEIKAMMTDPAYSRHDALVTQRDLLAERILKCEAMLGLIDKTLTSMEGGLRMTDEEMFEVFGDFDPGQYQEEVQERWGHTEAYKESARRTARYTTDDWQRFKTESDEITAEIAALMDSGVAPHDVRAMDAVERARLQIDRWFYPCSREMHAELGRMYVSDPRFTRTYEDVRQGMARYVCDAILANLARETR